MKGLHAVGCPAGAGPLATDVVLVVDDEPGVRGLFARVLRAEGHTVLEAGDGHEALALLGEHPVSIVLLDSSMPGLSGEDVLARIRADDATATLPVLIVTGRGESGQRVAGLLSGADDYVTKPVDMAELAARVRSHLRGERAWRASVAGDAALRATIAGALADVGAGETLEQQAAQVCELLAATLGVGRVAILARDRPGGAVLLATSGRRATAAVGHGLQYPDLRASSPHPGVWLVPAGRPPVPAPLDRALPRTTRPVVVAMLRGSDPWVEAALLLEAPPAGTAQGERAALDRLAALVADLAPMVSARLAPALAQRAARRRRETPIRTVLEQRAFDTVFQPIVELGSMTTMGYEALTRFDDGTPAQVRFAEAREVGLGRELELAAVEVAAERAHRLDPAPYVSVNVSVATLSDPALARILGSFDRRVVVEITEREPVTDYRAIRAALEALGDPPIAVDDTGAGYSSLRHILQLRPAYVKLDREWIEGIERDAARQALLVGLLHFATRIDSTVVAEGIERPEELDAVRGLGVYMGQGFLLGTPVGVERTGAAAR